MPYKIVNVSLQHEHAMKRRVAAKMHMEPMIAGKRLLLRSSMVLTDEQYRNNEPWLKEYLAHGIITIHPLAAETKKSEEKKVEAPKASSPPVPPAPTSSAPEKTDSLPPPPPPPASKEAPPQASPSQPKMQQQSQQQNRNDGKKQGK